MARGVVIVTGVNRDPTFLKEEAMRNQWEKVHHEKCGQLDIYFSWTWEEDSLRDHFPDDSEDEIKKIVNKINQGELTWFMAKVEARKCGVKLAYDILGGCLYGDPLDFVKANDYYADMKEAVIEKASVKLVELFTYKEEV